MNAKELPIIWKICLFTITLYVKAWLTAPVTCDAPYNDLFVLQSIEAFHNIDSEVADVALCKIKGHLWYVIEDLVGLSVFFDQIFTEKKKQNNGFRIHQATEQNRSKESWSKNH